MSKCQKPASLQKGNTTGTFCILVGKPIKVSTADWPTTPDIKTVCEQKGGVYDANAKICTLQQPNRCILNNYRRWNPDIGTGVCSYGTADLGSTCTCPSEVACENLMIGCLNRRFVPDVTTQNTCEMPDCAPCTGKECIAVDAAKTHDQKNDQFCNYDTVTHLCVGAGSKLPANAKCNTATLCDGQTFTTGGGGCNWSTVM